MSEGLLCQLDELEDPGTRGFQVQGPRGPAEIFLVRQGERIYAYLNSCPHTGGPLDWLPHQFLDLDRQTIQCATHDARFRIGDGICLSGPCVGQQLTAVEVVMRGRMIYLPEQAYRLPDGDRITGVE